ncbi:FAD:protein FMN transferase [Herbiconiux sp. CPCC 205763]|uniref:FAD:protein FMN transferase n=1 Tax=Herbiconiux aconitum TaxID=2970913 RepID=A0ABT2GSI0_9MICO|nr:FAD:protein FMN transferase [Herbiconiux aconitum]MCS5717874.1 FAD:protein FMN transferase [Herbiconiux aconitum]
MTDPAFFDFEAIGTHWQIETASPLDAHVRQAVLERVERFDATYSRFRTDSLVTAIAERPGRYAFPDDAVELFALYDRLAVATAGAVDPLVGRDLELLGYDRDYSLRPAVDDPRATASGATDARGRPSWNTDIVREGRVVTTERPVVIDVGAAGKGLLVDLVAGVLREQGIDRYVVDASGDLVHAGPQPIRVGLEHPLVAGQAIGVAELQNASLCASASNRRSWGEGLHHILDGRTGNPARDVIATWVVAADTALADGLATALFFTGAHRLAETFHFSYVRLYADGRAERSRDFRGELFT